MSDEVAQKRIARREALKKAAAVGGALWVIPAVQTVDMAKAWAVTGSGGPNDGSKDRYTVSFDVDGFRTSCAQPSTRPCRCLRPEARAGGCSFAQATAVGRSGMWKVTVPSSGLVLEGFSLSGANGDTHCEAGLHIGKNAMLFRPHTAHGRCTGRITHMELTFARVAV